MFPTPYVSRHLSFWQPTKKTVLKKKNFRDENSPFGPPILILRSFLVTQKNPSLPSRRILHRRGGIHHPDVSHTLSTSAQIENDENWDVFDVFWVPTSYAQFNSCWSYMFMSLDKKNNMTKAGGAKSGLLDYHYLFALFGIMLKKRPQNGHSSQDLQS